MEIETKYAVKLFFPAPAFIQVYFESIANAFDAGATTVDVTISSDGSIEGDKLSIRVADNGEGFTEERFERFRRLREPHDAYHKGLGRLVYLHYFANVEVTSLTNEGYSRTFMFSESFSGESQLNQHGSGSRKTTLSFENFRGARLKSYDDLKPTALKDRIIEQFLPLLHDKKNKGEPFTITIALNTDEENKQRGLFNDTAQVTAADLPDLQRHTIADPALDLFADVTIWYSISDGHREPNCLTAASIDGRTIPLKLLPTSALPPDCVAIFLVESELFEGRSDSARQRLVLSSEIPQTQLYSVLRREVAALLNAALPAIADQNEQTKQRFEQLYPHLIGLFEDDTVGLIDADEAIETAQGAFFRQQRAVLEGDITSDEEVFRRSLEVSARSLTEYIVYRDVIIKKLEATTRDDLESVIHNLIVPQRQSFESEDLVRDIYRNNAWVLDDKFMTFRTILSERTMTDVIRAITLDEEQADDPNRPDISMVFSADPYGDHMVDVAVVELKRRTNSDKENTFAGVQLVKRARKLVDFCPNIQRVWYYGLMEIDTELEQTLTDMKWVPLFSRGQVFYQEFSVQRSTDGAKVPTPVFLVSYDALTKDAAARNHAFLELLREGFKSSRENLARES